jgi:hypothetical protein
MRLGGLGKLKNSMISSGIETATFRVLVESLNQPLYREPQSRIFWLNSPFYGKSQCL